MNILDRQIKNQVNGTYTLHMHYTDIGPEHLGLKNTNDGFFIRALYMKFAKITESEFLEIMKMVEHSNIDQLRESDAHSKMGYDEFWNKYYNGREKTDEPIV